jgi:hypothetical protein
MKFGRCTVICGYSGYSRYPSVSTAKVDTLEYLSTNRGCVCVDAGIEDAVALAVCAGVEGDLVSSSLRIDHHL